jgi:hypothetical protein
MDAKVNDSNVVDQDIFAPAWKEVVIRGKTYIVHELEYAAQVEQLKDQEDGMLFMLIECVRKPDGGALWSKDDIPAMRKFSRTQMVKLINAALEVNGYDGSSNEEKSSAQSSTPSIN